MENLQFRTNDIIALTSQLLRKLKVKMNFETLKTKLETHPFYPSLLSVSDFLNEYGIENITFQIKKEQYNLSKLPVPFIAYHPDNEGLFSLVHEIKNGQISISGKISQNVNINENEFLKFWTGIGLHAQSNKESGEHDFYKNKIKYMIKRSVLLLCVMFVLTTCTLIFRLHDFLWTNLTLLTLKFGGLMISILLLIQSINAESKLLKRICGFQKEGNCNSLITSEAAKIASWISWSEIGFFYFFGSFLLFLIFPASVIVMSWLNLFAILFTFYSIIYQYKKKTWCILCCSVQALIWLEFITLEAMRYLHPYVFNLLRVNVYYYVICFFTPVLLWTILKPVLLNAAALKGTQRELNHFKYNSNIFNQILKHQSHHKISKDLFPVLFGSPTADIVITIVSNPFCNPCRKIHHSIAELLNYRKDFKINVLFAINNEEEDHSTKVARHMIALNLSDDKNLSRTAIDDWYKNNYKDYEIWAKKYPLSITEQVKIIATRQKQWCETAEIDFTPTILVSGYKLPDPYVFEDLKYLID